MSVEPNKVFVGGLPLEVTSEHLKEYAATFGEIKDAVVMTDKLTRRSRGFGFITFIEVTAAEACLHKQGPHELMGKQIEIKPTESQEDPNPEWKLFIGGLSDAVTDEDLRAKFSEFGTIKEATVMMRDGVSRRFGFVSYKSEDEFSAALLLPSMVIKDKEVEVKVAQMPRGHHYPTEGKLYIGDLGETITQDVLQGYFAAMGELQNCTVMKDAATQQSKGFGFVQFTEPKKAYEMMRKPGGHVINGVTVSVKSSANNAPVGAAKGKGKDGKGMDPYGKGYGKGMFGGYYPPGQGGGKGQQDCTNKIFVGGLPPTATNDVLKQFFSQYGPLKDSIAMHDRETGKPRGFGYVTFQTELDMFSCINDKANHYIDSKYIDVKKATTQGTTSYGPAAYGMGAYGAAAAGYGYGAAPGYGYGQAAAYGAAPAYGMPMDPNAAAQYAVMDPAAAQYAAVTMAQAVDPAAQYAAAYQQQYAAAYPAQQYAYVDPNAQIAYQQQAAAGQAYRPGPYS